MVLGIAVYGGSVMFLGVDWTFMGLDFYVGFVSAYWCASQCKRCLGGA